MIDALFRSVEGPKVTDEKDMIISMLCHVGVDVNTATAKVSEMYSPPRVTAAADKFPGMNIKGLKAFDLSTKNPNGVPWDFGQASHRAMARRICSADNPDWIIGSPPCTPFSILNRGLNYPKMDPAEVKRRIAEGRVHLAFCAQLYKDQISRGKHFLHEHPASASSWWEPEIAAIQSLSRVYTCVGHMCQYGMTSKDAFGVEGHVLKPTRWMSTSAQMLSRLSKRCPHRGGEGQSHRHVHLTNGRAAGAAIYPPQLCLEILRGIRDTTRYEKCICGIMQNDEKTHLRNYAK
jgi:hypothetical protein